MKDINPGLENSNPDLLVAMGDAIYFAAIDETGGQKVWKTDGTGAGTLVVMELTPGPGSSNIGALVAKGNTLLIFTNTYDNSFSGSLYISDGTPAGTTHVDTPAFGAVSGNNNVAATNDFVAFSAGLNLWITDGTTKGTFQIPETEAGDKLSVIGNKICFDSEFGPGGEGLYVTDGTIEGTVWVDSFPLGLTSSDGKAYYVTYSPDYQTTSIRRYDGNTTISYSADLNEITSNLFVDGSTVYFYAKESAGDFYALWNTDGTVAGTNEIKYLNIVSGWSVPQNFMSYKNQIYFSASTDENHYQLWHTDGTQDGTVILDESSAAISVVPQPGNDLLFFTADASPDAKLWASDGTQSGTKPIIGIEQGGSSSNPMSVITTGNKVFFTATGSDGSGRLYVSDGTSAGTSLFISTAAPGGYLVGSASIALIGSTLTFCSNDTKDFTLYATDASGTAPTVLIGKTNAIPYVLFKNDMYYYAYDATYQHGLLKSDGTAAGTVYLNKVLPASGSFLMSAAATSSAMFYSCIDPANGNEIWKTDGTTTGTAMIKDINPGTGSSRTDNITTFGEKVLFTATDGITGVEPWVSDGTSEGTIQLADIKQGMGTGITSRFAVIGNTGYFYGYSADHGYELWKTDGTAGGTVSIRPFGSTAIAPGDKSLVSYHGSLIFAASDETHGVELWKIDASGNQTMIADVTPGGTSSGPADFVIANDSLFFLAVDASGLRRLWVTDGTASRTHSLDFTPSLALVDFYDLKITGFGNQFLIGGATTDFGTELYSFELPVPVVAITTGLATDETEIQLFPNPGVAVVQVRGLNSGGVVSLTDVLGRSVDCQELVRNNSDYSFNISHLSPGVYFARITNNEGTITRKMVKN